MPSVTVKDGEAIEGAIRRFKRAVEKAGVPKELRRREFFQKDSILKRRQNAAARKRLLKKLLRDSQAWVSSAARGAGERNPNSKARGRYGHTRNTTGQTRSYGQH